MYTWIYLVLAKSLGALMSKALWTISQTNTDPSAGDDQTVADPMTGLSAQWDGGLGGFLFSDETSDLGDRVFDRSGGSEGRGEIDASTAELAVNGLAEDDANSGTSPVENVLPALSQDAGTEGGAQSAAATEAPVTIADGGAAVIEGPSSQSVVFAGSSGTLTLDDAQGFHRSDFGPVGLRCHRSRRHQLRRRHASHVPGQRRRRHADGH